MQHFHFFFKAFYIIARILPLFLSKFNALFFPKRLSNINAFIYLLTSTIQSLMFLSKINEINVHTSDCNYTGKQIAGNAEIQQKCFQGLFSWKLLTPVIYPSEYWSGMTEKRNFEQILSSHSCQRPARLIPTHPTFLTKTNWLWKKA